MFHAIALEADNHHLLACTGDGGNWRSYRKAQLKTWFGENGAFWKTAHLN